MCQSWGTERGTGEDWEGNGGVGVELGLEQGRAGLEVELGWSRDGVGVELQWNYG